jgi:hypothetical protein
MIGHKGIEIEYESSNKPFSIIKRKPGAKIEKEKKGKKKGKN